MSREIEAVRGFSGLRVLVVGDAMLDSYYLGTATRLAPEGPVPVVRAVGRRLLPGGAANTALNAAALGGATTLLSAVGLDPEADALKQRLVERGVDVSYLVTDATRPTTTKLRVMADEQFIARFDQEDDSDLRGDAARAFLEAFRTLFARSDVIVVSDYMKGTITPAFVADLSALNRDQSRLVVVDSKDLSRHRFRNVSVITPNHLEAKKALANREEPLEATPRAIGLEDVGRRLLEQIGTRWVMMTVGAEGALLFERGKESVRIRTHEVRNPDSVGAGDTFTAALALALGARLDISQAARVAVEAAAIAVGKRMTAAVEQQELLQRLSLLGDAATSISDLGERLEQYRSEGKRVVFTNGFFDGLHSGHIGFIKEARKLGDLLIVGVNSDESLRRITGRKPRYPEEERLAVLAALETVDHALLFDEETPSALIREIRPDVHVKGGDYGGSDLPELAAVRETGGQVVIVPLVEPRSSRMLEGKLARSARRRSA